MKIERLFLSGAAEERFERRCRRLDRVNRIADIVAACFIAAGGGAAVALWLAWLVMGAR